MKAVMYGAGNIGRGFIGMLFSASGYTTTFIDVAAPVVEALNREGKYPVRIVDGDVKEDIDVINVCAVNGNDADAVADVIAHADVMATAVGVNILKFIVSNLAAGIRKRKEIGGGPLNILICENLMDANKVLEGMLKPLLSAEECAWFDENIGLVEVSIGRMVPVQTDEMKDGNPLRVCVERYGFLPADKAAFKGEIPPIKNMVPYEPFDYYIKRKLYIHNSGHAVCAYLGNILGIEYIYEAIDKDEIYIIVRNAMQESALSLSKQYGVPLADIFNVIEDLLKRFNNSALRDTCQRVGGDPKRKLSPADRLIGAATLALKNGILPAYIAIGAAAALRRFIEETEGMEQTKENAAKILEEVSQLDAKGDLAKLILDNYAMIMAGASFGELRRKADRLKSEALGSVI